MDPRRRRQFAWVLLVVSIVGWPVSALTFASGEPPSILGLSWLAIAFTALDILATTDVRVKEDEDG